MIDFKSIFNGLDGLFTSDEEKGAYDLAKKEVISKITLAELKLEEIKSNLALEQAKLKHELNKALISDSGAFGKFMYFFNRLKRTFIEFASIYYVCLYFFTSTLVKYNDMGEIMQMKTTDVVLYIALFLIAFEHLGERGLTLAVKLINQLRYGSGKNEKKII